MMVGVLLWVLRGEGFGSDWCLAIIASFLRSAWSLLRIIATTAGSLAMCHVIEIEWQKLTLFHKLPVSHIQTN